MGNSIQLEQVLNNCLLMALTNNPDDILALIVVNRRQLVSIKQPCLQKIDACAVKQIRTRQQLQLTQF